MNNYDPKQALNQQIKDNNIPNTQPIEIAPMSESNGVVNGNVPTTTNKLPVGLKIYKSSQPDKLPSTIDEILDFILDNVPETNFENLLELTGATITAYYTNGGDIRITEDHQCALAVSYGLDIASNLGYTISNRPNKNNELAPFIYNGKYWESIKPRQLIKLFRQILIKAGMDRGKATILPRLSTHLNNGLESIAIELPQRDITKRRLNLANGVIEVVNGKVVFDKCSPSDGFIYCMKYDYSHEAKAPLFTKYLNRIMPDKESQTVLQEAMGLALINENIQKIPYLLGEGSNGKSVLNEIMLGIFGGNMKRITLRNLMGDKSERNQAMLEGVFINYPPENEDVKPNEFRHELFRSLADRNPITVQKLYEDLYDIEQYAYSVFNVNHLPRNPELSHAFFRRVLPIAFTQIIHDHEKDPDLAKKVIANELSGVLNWVIEGAIRLQKNKKFSHCKISDEVLAEYKEESDVVAMWLSEREYQPDDFPTLLTKLFNDLNNYMNDNGYKYQIKITTLASRLRSHNYRERNGKPRAFYIKSKNNA